MTGAYSAPGPEPLRPAREKAGEDIVRAGDTVHIFAQRHGIGVRALVEANGLVPPFALVPGQVLRIPAALEYTVVAGDTLYAVAKRSRVSMAELSRLNGLTPPFIIRIGQVLRMPDSGLPDPPAAARSQIPTLPPAGGREGAMEAANAGSRGAGSASAPGSQAPQQAALLAPALQPPARFGRSFAWPLKGEIVSSYGTKATGLRNDGVNIAAPRGTAVRAAEGGIVAYAGNELRGFGNLVLLRHADGWITAYAHNDEILVRRGDRIERGQEIARVGSTGNVSAPQLHFEIRKGGEAQDPVPLLSDQRAGPGAPSRDGAPSGPPGPG
ncbi:MAG: peptidoglycan DD-metalloendopeptidase family protein [Alphaproteobacteria bacterium]